MIYIFQFGGFQHGGVGALSLKVGGWQTEPCYSHLREGVRSVLDSKHGSMKAGLHLRGSWLEGDVLIGLRG
jgi:hypothetical protein